MYNIGGGFRDANRIITIVVVPELFSLSMYIYILWVQQQAVLLLKKLSNDSSISLSGSIYEIYDKII